MKRSVSNLHSFVAVLRGQDEAGQVGGQVEATEIPHQVPEDDGVLAEELVGVDHLGWIATERLDLVSCAAAVRQIVCCGIMRVLLPDLPRSPAGSPAPCAAPRG